MVKHLPHISIEKYAAYLDGNLPDEEMQQMKAFIDTDADMQAVLEADSIIGGNLDLLENEPIPYDMDLDSIELPSLDNGLIFERNDFINDFSLLEVIGFSMKRRFLYKNKFNKPTLEARMKIWQTMLPELPEEHVGVLAEKFDFSGGQIENIARHYTIDSILHGDTASSLETLMAHCEGERLEIKEHRKIGF